MSEHGERNNSVVGDPLLRTSTRPGRAETLAELYSLHHVRLMGLAAAVMLDRSAAGDVVQDAFAGLAGRFDSVERPEAYLQRSVVNGAIAVVRERERSRSVPGRPLRHSTLPDVDEAWDRLADLPAQQRAVVVLRFWEDLTQEQIASVLSLRLGTVKSTLHRALRTLRSNWPADMEGN